MLQRHAQTHNNVFVIIYFLFYFEKHAAWSVSGPFLWLYQNVARSAAKELSQWIELCEGKTKTIRQMWSYCFRVRPQFYPATVSFRNEAPFTPKATFSAFLSKIKPCNVAATSARRFRGEQPAAKPQLVSLSSDGWSIVTLSCWISWDKIETWRCSSPSSTLPGYPMSLSTRCYARWQPGWQLIQSLDTRHLRLKLQNRAFL